MCCNACGQCSCSGPHTHRPDVAGCTCGAWMSILPPPPCPVHGQAQSLTVTC